MLEVPEAGPCTKPMAVAVDVPPLSVGIPVMTADPTVQGLPLIEIWMPVLANPEIVMRPPAPAPVEAPAPTPSATGDTVIELGRLRKRIAENMVQAKRTAAHVWTSVEVDFEAVEQVRRRHKEPFKAQEGFSLTYLPFISRAAMDALSAFPVVNSSFNLDEGQQIIHGGVNLGIAVDLNQEGKIEQTGERIFRVSFENSLTGEKVQLARPPYFRGTALGTESRAACQRCAEQGRLLKKSASRLFHSITPPRPQPCFFFSR